MNQCSVVMQVASSEEQVMRLQRELHQSAAETEKHLTAVRKLETERSSLRDELETTKEEVCSKTYLIQVKHLHQFLAFFFQDRSLRQRNPCRVTSPEVSAACRRNCSAVQCCTLCCVALLNHYVMVSDMMTETTHYKLCLLVHRVFVGYAPDYIASLLTFLHGRRCVPRVTVTRSYQERVRRLVTGLSLLPHPCLESAADRLETLAFATVSFKSKLKSFLFHAAYTGNTA